MNDVGGAERPPSVRTAFVLGGGGGGTWGAVEVGMLQSLVDHGAAFAADPSAATDRYLDTIDVRQALRQDR